MAIGTTTIAQRMPVFIAVIVGIVMFISSFNAAHAEGVDYGYYHGRQNEDAILRASTGFTQGAESTAAPALQDDFPSYWDMDSYWTEWVQNYLVEWGYNVSIDGQFGPKTAQAVKDFQYDHGLTVTGVVDVDTAKALGFDLEAGRTLYYQANLEKQARKSTNGWFIYVAIGGRMQISHIGVFQKQADGHWQLVKSEDCITGDQQSGKFTPLGRFTVSHKTDRKHGEKDGYGYSYYDQLWLKGNYAIHSILQWDNGEWDTTPLGAQASEGCVRVSLELSKWLSQNIPHDTIVVIDDRAWQPSDIY